jgi:Polyketide cyclase / dehydrase and lipid transport
MGRVRARIDVPARASDAETLWYDHRRWPAFVDGLKHVARVTGDWPHPGAEVVWDAHPGGRGRGRVLERVLEYEARRGQAVAVEDERLRGTQRVGFAPHAGGVTVTLELDYEPKDPRLRFGPLDLAFLRRPQREALERTLRRFAAELRAEAEPGL